MVCVLSWVRSFLISIAIHVLIVVLIATLPKPERDPRRFLRHRDAVQPLHDDYRAPVVFMSETETAEANEAEQPPDEALPAFAADLPELEPEMPGIVSRYAPSSEAPTDDEKQLSAPKKVPSPAAVESVLPTPEVKEELAQNETASALDEAEASSWNETGKPNEGDAPETGVLAQNTITGVVSNAAGSSEPTARDGRGLSVSSGEEASSGKVATDGQQALWAAYAKLLSAYFAKKRPYPAMAKRMGHQGTVWIELELARSGKLLSSKVYQSSGSKLLDSAALDVVKKAKIPPFPDGVEEEKRVVRVDFRYSLK